MLNNKPLEQFIIKKENTGEKIIMLKINKPVFLTMLIVFISLLGLSNAQILLSDTFIGADNTKPARWDFVNAPKDDFWYIEDGQLNSGNGDFLTPEDSLTGDSFAVVNTSEAKAWADYTVRTDFWMNQRNGRVIFVGRWQDAKNHYESIISVKEGSRTIAIVLVKDDKTTILAQAVHNMGGVKIPQVEDATSSKESHTIEMTFVGSNITFSLDGKEYLKASDNTINEGTAGLGQRYNEVIFDNFMVAEPGAKLAASEEFSTKPSLKKTTGEPSTSTQQNAFKVILGKGLSKEEADEIKKAADEIGYLKPELSSETDGYQVLAGNFLSQKEAEDAKSTFENEGFLVVGIKEIQGGAENILKEASSFSQSYKVLMAEFESFQEGEDLKVELEGMGYIVAIEKVGNLYQVLLGDFKTENDAKELQKLLFEDGYTFASVIPWIDKGRETVSLTTAIDLKAAVKAAEAKGLSDIERDQIIELIKSTTAALQSDSTTAGELEKIREQFGKLEASQREVVDTLKKKEDSENIKRLSINRRFTEVSNAMDKKDWDAALSAIDEILKIDPENGKALLKKETVIKLKNNIKYVEADELELTQISANKEEKMIFAMELKKSGKYEEALIQLRYIKDNIDGNDEKVKSEIMAIQNLIYERDKKEKRKDIINFVLIAGGVALAIFMLFMIIWSIIRARRRDKELLRQVQELTVKPLLNLTDESIQQQIEQLQNLKAALPENSYSKPYSQSAPRETTSHLSSFANMEEELPSDTLNMRQAPPPHPRQAPSKRAPEPVAKKPVREMPEEIVIKPEPVRTPPPREEESIDSILNIEEPTIMQDEVPDLDFVNLDSLNSDESKSDEMEISMDESPSLSLDDILTENDIVEAPPQPVVKPVEVKPAPVQQEAPPKPKAEETVVNVIKPPIEEKPTQPEVKKEPPKPVAPKKDDNTFYKQTFDDEAVSQEPLNWEGKYDYSSLLITDETPASNSTKSMKFEKSSGSGSAYYACKFPEASGLITVEFDIRCNEKNKYLLGFYIEKDEDFRQSIHTIIHKTDSSPNPSIRIHGEPVPYEFSKWAHIKYDIDLFDGVVSGYLNNSLIVDRARLAIKPQSINTLSIRDNLATTGVLLIDNIHIYKS